MRLRKKHWAIPEMKENSYVFFDGQRYKGKWDEVFQNGNPIILEIGAGKGKFTTELAKEHPELNFIMVEFEPNAFVYATRKILEKELNNVRALPIHAENLLEYFEKDEISKIYINFCNPWPKNRHKKRRLTYPDYLKRYEQILKPEGLLELRTDDRPFFEDSLDYFEKSSWEKIKSSFDTRVEDYGDPIITEYETKWRAMNLPICYGVFKYCKQ
ncbi:MAG: tRNA (guanosine(46)-N7)-methyltransferase TrmB [Tissierellia bacterium]|nr:tRNA (guanosine(46)-N7)-methyltransferase TrmB [Tissierellia bacterium]